MIEFKLPSLGADMDQGKLIEWKVKAGDTVKRGQVVAIVDTSKAAVEVEIWHDGVIDALITRPGETIPVGTVMAKLRAAGEAATAPAVLVASAAGVVPPPVAPALRKAASPAARKRAHELDVDIESITGTGPHGAVTIADVEKAAAAPVARPAVSPAPTAPPPPAVAAPADRNAEMRKAIAAAMSRSKREIPHYYLAETIPMRRALEYLTRANEARPVTERVLMGALQLKAVALALKDFPDLNGFWRDGGFQPATGIHIGVAISMRQGGLIAPAIHDVAELGLEDLMRALADLVKRARAGSLRSSEMSDPTITVTNLGDRGVESVFGVIYPPQVALVGFGRIVERAFAEDGALRAAPVVTATLAADHRVSDGHRGARFLAALRDQLQRPEEL
jgi:pyruvate dehydrogenase E2 component (dihydrolipoamide acetyltransferase)